MTLGHHFIRTIIQILDCMVHGRAILLNLNNTQYSSNFEIILDKSLTP